MKKTLGTVFFLALAANAQAANLYTSMPFLNQVAVVDLETSAVTTVDVGEFPRGLKVSLDGTKVYVANAGDASATPSPIEGGVSVIEVATGNVSTITLSGTGVSANYTLFSPNGSSAYVTNSGNDSVHIIDVNTDTELMTVTVGDDPQGMAINSDASRLYVTNRSDGTLSVIDATVPAVIETVDVGSGASQVAVSPDDGLVYVSNLNDATVSVIDAENNTVIDTILTNDGPAGLLVSENGDTLYVVNHVGATLQTFDTTSLSETGSLELDGPFLAAFDPETDQIYVSGSQIVPITLDPFDLGTTIETPGPFTFGIDIVGSTNPGSASGTGTTSAASGSSKCSLSTVAGSASGFWMSLAPLAMLVGLRLRKTK